MITPYTIPCGFFKGLTIYIDDSLPPDCCCYEYPDGRIIVFSTVTGK